MHEPDSWEGAVVRGRDGRKGRVLQDRRTLLHGHELAVTWEDETISVIPSTQATMLRPPIGYRDTVPPMKPERLHERIWPHVLALTIVLGVVVTLVALAVRGH